MPNNPPPAILLSAAEKNFATGIFFWLGLLVVIAVVLSIIAIVIRRRFADSAPPPPLGFTLADLRQLHAQGQLSDEELAHAEAKSLARSKSLYLGDDAENVDNQETEADSSTNDPPPFEFGAENPPENPDKNG